MKVLAIVSSPRKGGNGQLLAEHLLSGAEEAGAEIEHLRLTELVIQPCLDCGFCKHPDHETCVQQDDMQNLYQKTCRSRCIDILPADLRGTAKRPLPSVHKPAVCNGTS